MQLHGAAQGWIEAGKSEDEILAGGFYAGMGWGAVVSVVVAGGASLMGDLPDAVGPESATLEVPAGSQFDTSRRDTPATLPGSDTPENAQTTQETTGVSRVIAPEPDDLSPMQGADTASATQPDTGNAEGAMQAPQSGDAPQVDVVTDTPVAIPSARSALPQVAQEGETLSISTDPAQPTPPQVPQIGSTESAFSGTLTVSDGTELAPEMPAAQTAQDTDNNTVQEAQPEQPQQPLMEALEVDTVSAPPVPVPPAQEADNADMTAPEMAETVGEDAIERAADTPPVVASVAPVQPPAQPAVAPDIQAAMQPAAQPPETTESETPAVQPAPAPRPRIALQSDPDTDVVAAVKPFQNLAPNVATNRLPTLGAPDPATATATATGTGTEAGTEEAGTEAMNQTDIADLPPIERFAVGFENPDNKPVMAIVLIDDGTSPIGLEALSAFPYPVSFAVDTAWDKAGEAMADYRSAGFEVLALVDLAAEATGQDVEANMAVKLRAVPEAVAIMEGAQSGIQGNRAVSDQVTAIAQASGLGLVLFPKGLNTAQKLAVKAGVPAAAVFRDFDGKGQNAKAIRRFLDHAAFKAGQQDGGVIMVGRLRADTIGALLLWGLQDRANRVALAPVSAVLTGK
ncbi:MAG: divergent polysaccharide deacetylase family protein [Rhodobacterales bacterium]|nr:divergent polysaccharide deacetylase family protein [Rhodobacterales bacterium]